MFQKNFKNIDLATDTIVWRNSATFGTAWGKAKDVIIKKPVSVTNDDIEVIVTIAELLSFRYMGRQLGLFFDVSEIEGLFNKAEQN